MTWFLALFLCSPTPTCQWVVLPARYETEIQCVDAGKYAVGAKLAAARKCIPTTRPSQ